jgi:hypothetical protein
LLKSKRGKMEFSTVPPTSDIKKPLVISAVVFCTLFILFILRNNSSNY